MGRRFGVASGIPAEEGNVIREGRILTFKLGGEVELPAPPQPRVDWPEPPPMTASVDVVEHGEDLFHAYCSVCHGGGAVSSGVLPDLRYMDEQTHAIFEGIVRGAYAAKGMASFSHVLDSERGRRACLSDQARARRQGRAGIARRRRGGGRHGAASGD